MFFFTACNHNLVFVYGNFFPLMFLFLQGEEIFLDMFEDEYRSMMVSRITEHIVLFATTLLLSVITWWYNNTSCFWGERKPLLSIWHLLDKEWLIHIYTNYTNYIYIASSYKTLFSWFFLVPLKKRITTPKMKIIM